MGTELSLLDDTYLKIKSMIIRGQYPPGSRLVVSKLSSELGVSHTPINESLNRLLLEGYVEFLPKRGMKVKKLTFAEITETYELRKMIELYCVDAMIEYAKNIPGYIEELKKCTDEQLKRGYEATEDSMDTFFNYEAYFHLLLISAKNNKQIYNMYKNLKANSMFYFMLSTTNHKLAKKRYSRTMKEHADIIRALESGSARKLKTALVKHLEYSENNLVETIRMGENEEKTIFAEHLKNKDNQLI